MNDFGTFFLILISISVFYVYLENKAADVTYVKHKKVEFLVRNLDDKEQAAKLLSDICTRLSKIIKFCFEKKVDYDKETEKGIERMKKNFNSNNVVESSPGNKFTSYSINKGEKIVFCIRSKDGLNTLVDLNTMMFVAIHEAGHLMTESVGHDQSFWDNMRFLLQESMKIEIYEKQDFINNPVDYCGTVINDTPLK